MILTPITIDINEYPIELRKMLVGTNLYDSSCSKDAKVVFIEKDNGYFLKKAAKGALEKEAILTKYFNSLGLAANVLLYLTADYDWLLTEKVVGEDCTSLKYLHNPKKLCDDIAEHLAKLHSMVGENCPVGNHTEWYLETARINYHTGKFDMSVFQNRLGYETVEEAWQVVVSEGKFLQSNTLVHGDYCLPNIILNNGVFSGFVDLGNGGIGDKHLDLFWGAWTLFYNLKTDKYRERFFDVYGKNKIDQGKLRIIAAVEVFG